MNKTRRIIMLVFFLIIGTIYYFFEPFIVPGSDLSVKTPCFEKDFERIKKVISYSPKASIDSFTLAFNAYNGNVDYFSYRLVVPKGKYHKIYDIKYHPAQGIYTIGLFTTTESYGPYGSRLTGARLFEVLDKIAYKDLLGTKNQQFMISSTLEYKERSFSGDLSYQHYHINRDKIIRLYDHKKIYPQTFELAFIGDNKFIRSYIFGL